eukprot:54840-Eustigmatos_ZCMA.PRE.1
MLTIEAYLFSEGPRIHELDLHLTWTHAWRLAACSRCCRRTLTGLASCTRPPRAIRAMWMPLPTRYA